MPQAGWGHVSPEIIRSVTIALKLDVDQEKIELRGHRRTPDLHVLVPVLNTRQPAPIPIEDLDDREKRGLWNGLYHIIQYKEAKFMARQTTQDRKSTSLNS